jgi:hypothetical protein
MLAASSSIYNVILFHLWRHVGKGKVRVRGATEIRNTLRGGFPVHPRRKTVAPGRRRL